MKKKSTNLGDITDEQLIEFKKRSLERLNVTEKQFKAILNKVPRFCKKLEEWTSTNAGKLAETIVNIAPNDDYAKLIEGTDRVVEFLKNSAGKTDNWLLYSIDLSGKDGEFIVVTFNNKVVDDGKTLSGNVLINRKAEVKHTFAVYDS